MMADKGRQAKEYLDAELSKATKLLRENESSPDVKDDLLKNLSEDELSLIQKKRRTESIRKAKESWNASKSTKEYERAQEDYQADVILKKIPGDQFPKEFETKTVISGIESGIEVLDAINDLGKNLKAIIDGREEYDEDHNVLQSKTPKSEKDLTIRTSRFLAGVYFDSFKYKKTRHAGRWDEKTTTETKLFMQVVEDIENYIETIIKVINSLHDDMPSNMASKIAEDIHYKIRDAYSSLVGIRNNRNIIDEETRNSNRRYKQFEKEFQRLTAAVKLFRAMETKYNPTYISRSSRSSV